MNSLFQVPHAFQQKLSAEKTPTLCEALPAYDAMLTVWKRLQTELPASYAQVIEAGVQKLDQYRDRTTEAPAYYLSMCKSLYH